MKLKNRIVFSTLTKGIVEEAFTSIGGSETEFRGMRLAQTISETIMEKHDIKITSWEVSSILLEIEGVVNKTVTYKATKYRVTTIPNEQIELLKVKLTDV